MKSGSTDSDEEKADVSRRSLIKIVGVAALTTGMVSGTAAGATDQQGYGYDGYGTGGYGDGSGVAVSTDGATEVGETSATFNGSLTDLGGASSADVAFEYREAGVTDWTTTSAQTLSATGSFSQSVSGLVDGTDYEFRSVASASDGDTDTGTTSSFTTVEHSVAVSTDGATEVGETSASLDGSLTDLGNASSADVSFEYRQVGSSGWNVTATQSLTSTGSFSESLTGLTSGTEYEFRSAASASDGDSDLGSAMSFTTTTADSTPAIDRFDVSEAGSPNPHAEISVDWAVSDDDGDLNSVTVSVDDQSGQTVKSSETAISGSTASGSDSFKIKQGGGQDYDVTLRVQDSAGNSVSSTTTQSS